MFYYSLLFTNETFYYSTGIKYLLLLTNFSFYNKENTVRLKNKLMERD